MASTATNTAIAKAVNEQAWRDQVVNLARAYGWSAWTFNGSNAAEGWPDIALAHPRGDLIFAELKTETGPVRRHQRDTLAALRATPAEVYVWRPADIDEVAGRLARFDLAGRPSPPRGPDDPVAPITIDRIIGAVASEYRIDPLEILDGGRTQAEPRQVAMALARLITRSSLPIIGDAFNRNHTTVLHAVSTVVPRRRHDDEVAARIDRVLQTLDTQVEWPD